MNMDEAIGHELPRVRLFFDRSEAPAEALMLSTKLSSCLRAHLILSFNYVVDICVNASYSFPVTLEIKVRKFR